jgi:hypothetical protein
MPQSLVSLAKGDKIRTRREPKSTTTASSPSTMMTRPRPYLSWVTWSRTANCATGGSRGRALKGLPGRGRRDAARAGFINTSMRPSGLGDPVPAVRMPCLTNRRPHATTGRHRRRGRQRAAESGISQELSPRLVLLNKPWNGGKALRGARPARAFEFSAIVGCASPARGRGGRSATARDVGGHAMPS